MHSDFPEGADRLSVWNLACRLAGQNPIDALPTASTLDKLRQICGIALGGGVEWASVSPDRPPIFRLDGADAMALIAQMASRPDAVTDWQEARRQLTLIDVRRDYWERQEQTLAGSRESSRDGDADATSSVRQPENPPSRTVDFVSLAEALNFIAGTLDVPAGRTTAEDEPMWRASEAAAVLHEHLNNAPDSRPRWFEVNETTGKPLVKDVVAEEGMSILVHAAGWFERETKAQTDHILWCVKAGIEPTNEPRLRALDEGQWDYTRYFLREYRIGFARNELADLLGMTFGAVTANDKDEARKVLAKMYARLDHIAWAMVILAPDAPARGEARFRQIQGVTNWLVSEGLQFRTSGGLPASQPSGVSVAGMDVREYQYLAVADVRAAAIAARCWPRDADRHRNIEGASPWGNAATQSVELPAGRIPASVLAYRIAMALVDVPYGISTEALEARNRFEAVVSKHLDQMTDMGRQRALVLVTAEGIETNDISVGCLSPGDAKAYLGRYCIRWSDAVAQGDAAHPEAADNKSEPTTRTVTLRGDKWTDTELRSLLDESRMPGATHEKLGKKHNVSRARIGKLLQQARDKFETPAKASVFPSAATGKRKVRGTSY